MAEYLTAHFHNVADGREAALDSAFAAHVADVRRLRGFVQAQRFRIADTQLMPDIAQPWSHVTLYDFADIDPAIDIPALAPLLANLRDAALIADDGTERIHSYAMYAPWKYSANYRGGAIDHVMILLANIVPGRDAEYHRWYDDVHSAEVSASPGYVGMRRGGLADVQVPPVSYCPGSQIILGGMQTDDLPATFQEFVLRANGGSPSGIQWAPRSKAGSVARTVHIFKSIGGPFAA